MYLERQWRFFYFFILHVLMRSYVAKVVLHDGIARGSVSGNLEHRNRSTKTKNGTGTVITRTQP